VNSKTILMASPIRSREWWGRSLFVNKLTISQILWNFVIQPGLQSGRSTDILRTPHPREFVFESGWEWISAITIVPIRLDDDNRIWHMTPYEIAIHLSGNERLTLTKHCNWGKLPGIGNLRIKFVLSNSFLGIHISEGICAPMWCQGLMPHVEWDDRSICCWLRGHEEGTNHN